MHNKLMLLLLLFGSSVLAQTPFFTVWPGHPDFSPLPPPAIPGVEVDYPIAVDVRGLVLDASTRQRYSLRFADGTVKVFEQKRFAGEQGFVALGPSAIQPDPNLPDSALSWYWFGMAGNESLSAAVYQGRMSATVIAQGKHFAITESQGELVFRQFNPALVPTDAALAAAGPDSAQSQPEAGPRPKFLDLIDRSRRSPCDHQTASAIKPPDGLWRTVTDRRVGRRSAIDGEDSDDHAHAKHPSWLPSMSNAGARVNNQRTEDRGRITGSRRAQR